MQFTNIYEQFGSNKDAEKNGKWIKLEGNYPDGETPEYKVACMGGANRAYELLYEKKMRRLEISARRGAGDVPYSKKEKVLKEIFVETVLKDWKNFKNSEGEPLEFSKENALQLFKDLPRLYVLMLSDAQELTTFQDETLEEDAKN